MCWIKNEGKLKIAIFVVHSWENLLRNSRKSIDRKSHLFVYCCVILREYLKINIWWINDDLAYSRH